MSGLVAITALFFLSFTFSLNLLDNKQYWAVSWGDDANSQLSILEREQSNEVNTYNVRMFTTKALDVTIVGTQGVVLTTQPEMITDFFHLNNCSDLYVNNNPIDLCQIGNIGGSYLVIADENGQLVVVEE